jgi:hypothetical protein
MAANAALFDDGFDVFTVSFESRGTALFSFLIAAGSLSLVVTFVAKASRPEQDANQGKSNQFHVPLQINSAVSTAQEDKEKVADRTVQKLVRVRQ